MAPNASGSKNLDHERIINLSYLCLRFALLNSFEGANFVTKLWDGWKVQNMLTDLQKYYEVVEKVKPKASRQESGEIYLVARNFRGIKDVSCRRNPVESGTL